VGECFFWYRPTRVVPDKGPLNSCVCVCDALLFLIHCEEYYFGTLESSPDGIAWNNSREIDQLNIFDVTKECVFAAVTSAGHTCVFMAGECMSLML